MHCAGCDLNFYLICMNQHHESIPLAGHVLFSLQELGNQLRSIRDQGVMVSVYYKQISFLITWNYEIILTQTQYTFILIIKQTSHDWDGDHLKGPWLKAFRGSRSDLNLWLGNTVQDQCKSFYQRDSVGEVWARLDREEKISEHQHSGPLYNY